MGAVRSGAERSRGEEETEKDFLLVSTTRLFSTGPRKDFAILFSEGMALWHGLRHTLRGTIRPGASTRRCSLAQLNQEALLRPALGDGLGIAGPGLDAASRAKTIITGVKTLRWTSPPHPITYRHRSAAGLTAPSPFYPDRSTANNMLSRR